MKCGLYKTLLLAVCVSLILCSAEPAKADVPVDYSALGVFDFALVSGTEALNLRAGPGTEYEWRGSLAAGNWVGLLGESGNWYYVYLLQSGQYGYMSKNFLKRTEGENAPAGNTGVVTNPQPNQFLNLRAWPGYDAQVLGIFYNGAAFTLLSSTPDGWYQVLINGQVGYFRSEYVRLTGSGGSGQTAVIRSGNGGKVNLRNAPAYAGSRIVGQYAPGTQVNVVLSSPLPGSFWKVSVNGMAGYMDSTFLSVSSPVQPVYPDQPGGKPATSGTAVVKNPKATQKLNLRAMPSTTAKVVSQYRNGVKFDVIQAGETWTKVYGSASGNIGYFMTKYLRLSNAYFTKTVQNNGSFVNLRSSPSKTTGKVYVQVPSGSAVTVLIPGDEWCQVRYAGTVGYMMTTFLK
jgi:uncharacterized protein YgiM (DUF1202 family)